MKLYMNNNTYTMSIISAIILWDLKNRHFWKAYISETSLEKVIIPKVIIFGPIPEVENMISHYQSILDWSWISFYGKCIFCIPEHYHVWGTSHKFTSKLNLKHTWLCLAIHVYPRTYAGHVVQSDNPS